MTSKSAIPSLPLAPGTTVSYSIDPMLLQHFDPEDQWSSMRSEFISLKAPVVLYMLDKRIGRGNLQKVINKIMVSAMSGELPNGLSTHHFFKIAKKVSGKMELKAFADQWVYGCGVPKFIFNYTFNRKRMMVEFKFRQENVNTTEIGKVTKFMGPFTIRIHEPNGTFDTEVQIDEVEKTFDIPYHTKYKRIRRRAVRRPRKGKQEDPDDFMDDGMGDDADGDDRDVMDGPDTRDDATADWKDDEPDRFE
ncbi:hypothetical protein HK102_007966 [Quaeritorhiza haematococci]|nr:hypothetical protein HK102_007966 [Quaeritorhiza haematococci]